jgi:hypothetical protein
MVQKREQTVKLDYSNQWKRDPKADEKLYAINMN